MARKDDFDGDDLVDDDVDELDDDVDDLDVVDLDDDLVAEVDDDLDVVPDDVDTVDAEDLSAAEADEDEEDEDEEDDDEDDEEELAEDEEEESLDVLLAREVGVADVDLSRLDDDSRDPLAVTTLPIGEGEFTCRSCFLVKRRAQLADEEKLICLDCA